MTQAKDIKHLLRDEIKRVERLKQAYEQLPRNVGAYGASVMKITIDRAKECLNSKDIIGMMAVYEELKTFKG